MRTWTGWLFSDHRRQSVFHFVYYFSGSIWLLLWVWPGWLCGATKGPESVFNCWVKKIISLTLNETIKEHSNCACVTRHETRSAVWECLVINRLTSTCIFVSTVKSTLFLCFCDFSVVEMLLHCFRVGAENACLFIVMLLLHWTLANLWLWTKSDHHLSAIGRRAWSYALSLPDA